MQMQYQFTEEKLIDQLKLHLNSFLQDHNSGVLAQMLQHHFESPGKMVRPRLVFRLSEALSLPVENVNGWAMACELLHNATLIHDDLQDGDSVRRGRPTVWAKFGANMAINAGDQLLLLAPSAIQQINTTDEIKLKLLQNFTLMSTAIVDGQCREFELNKLESQNLYQDYIECIKGKTAALFSYLAQGVGIVAGLEVSKVQELHNIFNHLGIIFQIQDDLLDLFGEKKRDSIGCDVKEGKVSYLVVKHLELYPSDREQILNLLQKPRELTNLDDINWFKNLLLKSDSYQCCIDDFNLMMRRLLQNKMLMQNPALMEVVTDMLEQVLEPVAHLLPQYQETLYASTIN